MHVYGLAYWRADQLVDISSSIGQLCKWRCRSARYNEGHDAYIG